MSRIGKNPIAIPEGVEITIGKGKVTAKGPKGEISSEVDPNMKVEHKDGQLTVSRPNDSKPYRALHGLYRSLINNLVIGVTSGFEKKLEIVGVGYKAELKGSHLNVQVGYSHPIIFVPPDGIELNVENQTSITISGIDKQLVGQIAAKIRSFRPPEPYKGKGIKYENEYIRRKAGKTAA